MLLIAKSQNPINLTSPDSLKLPKDYNQFIPKDLSDIIDANIVLKNGLNGFMRDHLLYINFDFAIFPINGSPYYMSDAYRRKAKNYDYESDFQALKKLFFQNKSFYESLYSVCMPLYQDAVGQMSTYEVERLMDVLKSGLRYIKDFNAEKEQADENRLDNFAGNKGKLNAFIYRRIINKELTLEECTYWLHKIYKDLSAAVKLTGRAEEDYVIDGATLTPGIYTAKKHEDVSEEFQVLEKTKDGYRFLLPENAVVLTDFMVLYNNMAISNLEVAYPGGKKELIFFSSDTAGTLTPDYVEIQKIGVYPTMSDNFIGISSDSDEDYCELLVYQFDNDIKKRKLQKVSFDKKLQKLNIANDFAAAFSDDGSAELLYYLNENGKIQLKRRSFADSVLSFSTSDDGHYAFALYAKKVTELFFVNDNKLIVNKLAKNVKPNYIVNWKNFIIASNVTPLKEGKGERITTYRIFSASGKLALKDIFSSVTPQDSMDFLVLGKGNKYALFDKNMKALTGFVYRGNINEFSKKINTLPNFNYNAHSLILSQYHLKKGKLVVEATVFDRKGAPLILPKWPFIKVVNFSFDQIDYYAVCDKISFEGEEVKQFGKFALFGPDGKQLTGFIYDNISSNYVEEGYFRATKKGQNLLLTLDGKELP